MKRTLVLGILAALVSAGCSRPTQPPVPKAGRPNIILVLVDDLGYGDLGSYGQQLIQTPNLDRLAGEGMRFTQFYAGSTVCAPSRSCLMTGQHTGHTFIRGNGKENLRPDDVTLAEVLQASGYETALIGKWGLGHEGSQGLPTRQGFDYFFGYLDQHHAHNYYPQFLVRNEERVRLTNIVPDEGQYGQGVATSKQEYSHDLLTAEALSFIRRERDRPFFLYLAWTIPHANNEAGEEGMEVPDLGIYAQRDWPQPQKGTAAMVSRMDRDVGTIVNLLEELDLENTVVLFTSDNGPHKEGGNDPDFFDSNGPLKGIKRSLHEGGIRVPMIAWWPGHIQAGSTQNHVAAFWDLMPTLADLAQARKFVPAEIDGKSFQAALTGGRQPSPDFLYWAFYGRGGGQAIRMGDWKAIIQPIGTPLRLYDLSRDLSEKQDIASEHPDVVTRLGTLMEDADTPSDRWEMPPPGGM